MRSNANFDRRTLIDFLREIGCVDLTHSGLGLLSHLEGTYNLLEAWRCREECCRAGLFHSVYGTESYPVETIALTRREQVKELIGDEAEMLAYCFGVMKKDSFYANLEVDPDHYSIECRITYEIVRISPKQFSDLAHITLANWFEQRSRLPARYKFMRSTEFRKLRRHINPLACALLDNEYAFK
jgi:hypothetical protein